MEEEVLIRFPHLGKHIFDSLNNLDLKKCRKAFTSWRTFIKNQKFYWIRGIKEYVKMSNPIKYPFIKSLQDNSYFKNSNFLKKGFQKTRLKLLKNLAEQLHLKHKYGLAIKPSQTLLHFALDPLYSFENEYERLELFKNI